MVRTVHSQISIKKRSIVIDGHKTSVSLEDCFWDDLKELAEDRKISIGEVIRKIEDGRLKSENLSSMIRVFLYTRPHVI
jgi:predicted DNA-binding ribbon-helix-helix protein